MLKHPAVHPKVRTHNKERSRTRQKAYGMMQLMGSPWVFRSEMMVATYRAIDKLIP